MSKPQKVIVHELQFPDLEHELRELAVLDFEKFKRLAALDMVQIYVCVKRKEGLSLQQIAHKLKISKQAVSGRCKRCEKGE